MKSIARLALIGLLAALALPALALPKYVKWTAKLAQTDPRAGEGTQIVLTANIAKTWHIYSLTQPDGGPTRTTLKILSGAVKAVGNPVQPTPHKEKDSILKIDLESFDGTVAFGIPVTIDKSAKGKQAVKLQVRFMACASSCIPAAKEEVEITFNVAEGKARPNRLKPVTTLPKAQARGYNSELGGYIVLIGSPQDNPAPLTSTETPSSPNNQTQDEIAQAKSKGLLSFLGISITAGLLALLTPCVFPMIPITVSYFTKRKAGQRGGGVKGALAYCFGIVSTFTFLGVAVSVIFGAQKLSQLGTNPYVNLGFAILFIVLALNLMGFYEIALPSGLANKAQSASSQKGGYLQPYLMGFTFTLTSFTCTAPYVGTLLASGAKGGYLYPMVGMLAFSTAFAAPFFLLAVFPQKLAALPKSGSWLVTVKAYMGFMELAAAMKFLSNADMVWSGHWLSRPVFIAVWALVTTIAGLHLLGLLRLPHDSEGDKIGVIRRLTGVGTLGVALYLFAAMLGADLHWFEAFPPPPEYAGRWEKAKPPTSQQEVWFESYEEAVKLAKAQNKPLFIDFTGVTCVNCRLMERNVFPKPEVKAEMNNYILVRLWTDRESAQDEKNKAFQEKLTQSVALPTYVVVTPEGKPLGVRQGLQKESSFVEFLKKPEGSSLVTTR